MPRTSRFQRATIVGARVAALSAAACVAAPPEGPDLCAGGADDPPFAPPAVALADATAEAGLPAHGTECLVFSDLDGDDYPDLVLGEALFPDGTVNLFRNVPAAGGRAFSGRALTFGRGRPYACTSGDFDGDGVRDLAIGTGQADSSAGNPMQLYLLRGTGSLEYDVTQFPFEPDGWDAVALTTLGFLDFDGDADLDLYVGFSSAISPDACDWSARDFRCRQRHPLWTRAMLLRNDGGRFSRMPDAPADREALAVTAAAFVDWDDDGRTDVFVTHDFAANRIYLNQGDGSFRGLGPEIGLVDFNHGMGVAVGDLDRDCALDAYVADLGPHQLYYGTGDGRVVDRAFDVRAGVATVGALTRLTSSWSPVMEDLNNDGWLDVFVVNTALVHDDRDLEIIGAGQTLPEHTLQVDFLYVSDQRGGFSHQNVPHLRGDGAGIISGAVAVADPDRDGDLDLAQYYLAAQQTDRFRLLRNDTAGAGGALTVRLRGRPGASNPDAIGARVTLRDERGPFATRYLAGTSGCVGQSWQELHFGLGARATVPEIEVRWPSGRLQRLGEARAGQVLSVQEPGEDPDG